VKINGTTGAAFASPSSYLTLNRVWKTGDKIELKLPMGLHIDSNADGRNRPGCDVMVPWCWPGVRGGREGNDLRWFRAETG